jgi:hypothetical protein
MTITFAKDKQNEGSFLLRGLESELVEGQTVEVMTKSGKAIKKRVGPRRAGPFDDGVVLHEQGGKAPSAPHITYCPHCGCDVAAPVAPSKPVAAGADDGLPF